MQNLQIKGTTVFQENQYCDLKCEISQKSCGVVGDEARNETVMYTQQLHIRNANIMSYKHGLIKKSGKNAISTKSKIKIKITGVRRG